MAAPDVEKLTKFAKGKPVFTIKMINLLRFLLPGCVDVLSSLDKSVLGEKGDQLLKEASELGLVDDVHVYGGHEDEYYEDDLYEEDEEDVNVPSEYQGLDDEDEEDDNIYEDIQGDGDYGEENIYDMTDYEDDGDEEENALNSASG